MRRSIVTTRSVILRTLGMALLLAVQGGTPSGLTRSHRLSTESGALSGGPLDAQSTSGPTPPPAVHASRTEPTASAVLVLGVPAYTWWHGCGPTAAGMVIGYWDGRGFDALVAGDAQTQTAAVNAIIASTEVSSHYADYSQPLDYSSVNPSPLPDRSEPPAGDEHPDNCLADLMQTSQSSHENYYGWGWFSTVGPALQTWFNSRINGGCAAVVTNLYPHTLNWDTYRQEIDARRPMVLLVDTGGDGSTDHFVTAVGYDVVGGTPMYACLDTWNTTPQWHRFAPMARGIPWGIWGAVALRIEFSYRAYIPLALKQ